jgi:hypothetical protein
MYSKVCEFNIIYIVIVCIYKARATTRAVTTKPTIPTKLEAPFLTALSLAPLWFSVGVLVVPDGEEEPSDGELELPGALEPAGVLEPDGESDGFGYAVVVGLLYTGGLFGSQTSPEAGLKHPSPQATLPGSQMILLPPSVFKQTWYCEL